MMLDSILTTFSDAIARAPYLWGVAGISLITLAMLWRVLVDARAARRWQTLQLARRELGTREPTEPLHAAQSEEGEAHPAALTLVRGRLETLQLHTYEEYASQDYASHEDGTANQAANTTLELECTLSNLGMQAVQILELSLEGDDLVEPVVLDVAAVIAPHSSHTIDLRLGQQAFSQCRIFFSRFQQQQPQLYQLRCPIVWHAEHGHYSLRIEAQQLSPAMERASQRARTAANPLGNNVASSSQDRARDLATALGQSLEEGSSPIQQVFPKRATNDMHDAAHDVYDKALMSEPSLAPASDPEVLLLVPDRDPTQQPSSTPVVPTLEDNSDEPNVVTRDLNKALERWFDEVPSIRGLSQDASKVHSRTADHKRSWNDALKDSSLDGSSPEE